MITRQDVINAYKYILGREPENEKVIEILLNVSDVSDLRRIFLNSSEFYATWAQITKLDMEKYFLPSITPPMALDVAVSDEVHKEIFNHIKKVWEALGESEPHWSVLTHEKFKRECITATEDEFYSSGEHGVELLFSALERNNISTESFKSCLEYGCGIGRVTYYLAERFEKVYAYDISKNHLDLAGKHFKDYGITNTDFILVTNLEGLENLKKVDVIYSVIVLQHNPPPIISFILKKFMQALNTGGVAYFQVPTYRLGYKFSAEEYLNSTINGKDMEMHVLPQNEIFQIAHQGGGQIVEVREDNWIGRDNTGLSNTFLIQKRYK